MNEQAISALKDMSCSQSNRDGSVGLEAIGPVLSAGENDQAFYLDFVERVTVTLDSKVCMHRLGIGMRNEPDDIIPQRHTYIHGVS